MGRMVNSIGGIGLGVCLSQFPEFSQQYVQRLGGAVDELTTVVTDFDRSAADAGMSRADALGKLSGTEFLDSRQADMTRTIDRQERLAENYASLKDANAFVRLAGIHRFGDAQVVKGAWGDFQPAIPLSLEALALLFGGYSLGYMGTSGLGSGLRRARNWFRRDQTWQA